MPRMYSDAGGYANFGTNEVAEMEKIGWKIVTDAEFAAIIEAKKKPVVAAAPIVAEPMQGSQPTAQFAPEKRSYFKKNRESSGEI